MWNSLSERSSKKGFEGGIVLMDEEYHASCRITLEKCPGYYAITCGVYGGMVHTAFCGADNFQETYDRMKRDLQDFIDAGISDEEAGRFFREFTSKY